MKNIEKSLVFMLACGLMSSVIAETENIEPEKPSKNNTVMSSTNLSFDKGFNPLWGGSVARQPVEDQPIRPEGKSFDPYSMSLKHRSGPRG